MYVNGDLRLMINGGGKTKALLEDIDPEEVRLIVSRAELFEGRLALNPGFFFLCSKAFSRTIFCAIFRASNHQLVDKKN